jgi:hypothetical protein
MSDDIDGNEEHVTHEESATAITTQRQQTLCEQTRETFEQTEKPHAKEWLQELWKLMSTLLVAFISRSN